MERALFKSRSLMITDSRIVVDGTGCGLDEIVAYGLGSERAPWLPPSSQAMLAFFVGAGLAWWVGGWLGPAFELWLVPVFGSIVAGVAHVATPKRKVYRLISTLF